MLISPKQNRVLYDCFKLFYVYLNEGDKVCKCYGCLKMMIYLFICTLFIVDNH